MRHSLKTTLAAGVALGALTAQEALAQYTLPVLSVTASRLGEGVAGTSTTVITAEDIERSPAQTIQDVLSTVPGIQTRTLYGAVGGAGTNVDLRGFGAAGTSNTLVLINGRRLNDIDMAGVDYTSIPIASIERIEVIRGNSGAVLYGDNAVRGVINIITKTGAGTPFWVKAGGGIGSYGYKEGTANLTASSGGWSVAGFGSATQSDGYRANNRLNQHSGVGEIRYTGQNFGAFFNLSADDQKLGLPGVRRVNAFVNELLTDRRGTATPFDFGNKQGVNATGGVTYAPWNGVEFIIDGGVRDKKQQGGFADNLGNYYSYVDTKLTQGSFTPRVNVNHGFFGGSGRTIAGIDVYSADYVSARAQQQGFAPIHTYRLQQDTLAGYWQSTVTFGGATDISGGARIQQTRLSARDVYDPTAPAFFPDVAAIPLDQTETNHALHIGIEHRFSNSFAVFGRAARAFRTPNVDERLALFAFPTDFRLRTQTSFDLEAGVRASLGNVHVQVSAYDMRLKDEIHYNPVAFANVNLDPTHRYGFETFVNVDVTPDVRLKGALAYTRAVFTAGPNAGNDVPLVSPWTASAGVSWDIVKKVLVFDGVVRYVSERRFDNDQANFQPLIPASTFVDLRLGGQWQHVYWSFSVLNVFNRLTYDYGVASTTTFGAYSVYPMPGRVFMAKAGVTF